MIRIRLESKDFEESVLNGEGDIAVPIEITESGGDTEILTYAVCKHIAEEFVSLYGDDPITTDSMAWLYDHIAPVIGNFGFCPPDAPRRWINKYIAAAPYTALQSDDVTVTAHPADDGFDLSEFDIIDDGSPVAVKLADGKIVSAAYVNDLFCGVGAVEIGVDTLPNYRRMGHGASCVSALCAHLLNNGADKVIYCTYDDNIASNKTAVKAGFTKSARIFSCTCYKDEPEASCD